MRHTYQHATYRLCVLFLVSLSVACKNNPKTENAQTNTPSTLQDSASVTPQMLAVPETADSVILTLRNQILNSLKNKYLMTFASFIHPTLGIRFSPYASIDTATNRTFTRESFIKQINSKKKLDWGPYDAGEEYINMTLDKYMATFVYNADYLNAEEKSLNRIIHTGNSINNLQEVYPDCPFTECYFSGFKKEFEGMDWSSLRLVFKKHDNQYYLVGVVHDQWTS